MEKNITENLKLIAEYLGWKYVPFNDLQGFSKAGWYKVEPRVPNFQKIKKVKLDLVDGKWVETSSEKSDLEIDMSIFKYPKKNGWSHNDNFYFKYICRNHGELRFCNSMDALLPVIKKIEGEDLSEYFYTYFMQKEKRYNFNNIEFTLYNNGAYSVINWELDPCTEVSANFIEGNTWIQNTFQTVSETIRYITEIKTRENIDKLI